MRERWNGLTPWDVPFAWNGGGGGGGTSPPEPSAAVLLWDSGQPLYLSNQGLDWRDGAPSFIEEV